MNIQYFIGKISGYRKRAQYIGVNAYFGPRITNRPHATPNYGPGKYKFEMYYYSQTCYFP